MALQSTQVTLQSPPWSLGERRSAGREKLRDFRFTDFSLYFLYSAFSQFLVWTLKYTYMKKLDNCFADDNFFQHSVLNFLVTMTWKSDQFSHLRGTVLCSQTLPNLFHSTLAMQPYFSWPKAPLFPSQSHLVDPTQMSLSSFITCPLTFQRSVLVVKQSLSPEQHRNI